MTAKMTKQMLTLGKEWKKDEMHRIYISDLSKLYGLKCDRHKTGNIKSAKLNGEKISNTKATKLEIALNSAKFWYDVKSGEFLSKGLSDEQFAKIKSNVTK